MKRACVESARNIRCIESGRRALFIEPVRRTLSSNPSGFVEPPASRVDVL